jgi:endonuclease-3 related protein
LARTHKLIPAFYRTLSRTWGAQHWWPARTRFEVIVGAYLTQNTAWTNVDRALRNLRRAGLLSIDGVRRTPVEELALLIRSAGYFRQKAARLKTFVAYLDVRYGGSLRRMFARPTADLRQELLALNGVGPETADSILLYAGNHPVFVVDAYTRRILDRHAILPAAAPYEEIRELFERELRGALPGCNSEPSEGSLLHPRLRKSEKSLPGAAHRPSPMSLATRSPLPQMFNEMHALLVGIGKRYCWKKHPHCEQCPLAPYLPR